MIFDTPTKPTSQGAMSPNLQKSPLHKSTSALNETPSMSTPPSMLPMSGGSNKQHPQVASSYSMGGPSNYQGYTRPPSNPGQEHMMYPNQHRRYGYDPMAKFLVGGGDPYADEYDLSPPDSTVSASASVFSPPSNNTSRRSDQLGLRDFDLTNEFLTHIGESGDRRGQTQYHQQQRRHYIADNHAHAPSTGVRSEQSFGRLQGGGQRSNVSDNVVIPAGSSPVTHYKRASSPNLGFPVEGQGGYIVGHHQRERSPDSYPYHGQHAQYHRQHPQSNYRAGEQQYRSPHLSSNVHPHSYQTPSPIAMGAPLAHSNYNQHNYPTSSSAQGTPSKASQMVARRVPPNHQSSPQKPQHPSQFSGSAGHSSGQKRNAALWYDDNSGIMESTTGHNRMSGGSHMTPGVSSGGSGVGQRINHPVAGQVPAGQAPPLSSSPQGITMPRQHSEESYDLQEMLKIWDNSSKSPFGEGTLV